MDDFKNDNIYNDTSSKGELNGFDNVSPNEASENNKDINDGYYSKQKSDIIQNEAEPRFEPKTENSSAGSYNSGYSSNYSAAHNPQNTADYANHSNFSNVPYPNPYINQKPKKEKKRYGASVVVLACVLAVIIGALSGGAVSFLATRGTDSDTKITNLPNNNVNISVDQTAENIVEAVAEKVTPCVVGIRTTTSVMNFFGGTQESSGDGSGVIFSSEGYIITNYHVISDATSNKAASKIEVYLDSTSSEPYTATLVGYNISADLAVIKINATGLPAIEVADSDSLKVGQYVITVGNPGGLEFMDSVTYGVISGLNRVVSSSSGLELIQTDAAINPGNSGGALVNAKGQLVGINSSKIVSEEFEGMGFAIPSNTVVEICNNIIEKENSPEPYVGISISEMYTAEVLDYYGYPVGAVVLSVADGSPADEAGIERGDIITQYGDTEITEYTLLEDAVKDSSPGEVVTVKLYRGGKYYSAKITVSSNSSSN